MAIEELPFGKRVAPAIVDQRAAQTPNRTYAIIPRGERLEDGFKELSYANLANAVNVMAGWLEQRLAEQGDKATKTIAYMGADDLRYPIFILATQKIGRAPLMPTLNSNSPDARLMLLEKTFEQAKEEPCFIWQSSGTTGEWGVKSDKSTY